MVRSSSIIGTNDDRAVYSVRCFEDTFVLGLLFFRIVIFDQSEIGNCGKWRNTAEVGGIRGFEHVGFVVFH